ncbi:hypothetical protein ADU59_28425 [Pararhizobium polonicum]|uniref:Uncharacterized protein n=1 Tax=Pararhizobium polonicum TaxID=1612624 RepID=A0A1C7NT21_9HYPH|nr:hypothetical protein [Pararhizobium polonicum]OBZ92133.1 hypothetical protein ADU59_28425 [Pararhizobium polonicum]
MGNTTNSFVLSADGIEVTLDLDVGHISSFIVRRYGRTFSPFHRAPWIDEPLDASTPPHLQRLSIDFFCAPFGQSDVESAPAHGWSANAPWVLTDLERLPNGSRATFVLSRTIMSATLTKTCTVKDGHPFLYQSHRFDGGIGRLPVAYHAMVDLPHGGILSVSPKIRAETMPDRLETDDIKGRSILAYPASSDDLRTFPREDGGVSDLLRYPLDDRHVDLVMLHEQPSNPLGWAIAARPVERDMAIVLKPPGVLPSTVLWYSNGGRHYAPWNGRHHGVLGIEEARTFFGYGHKASIAPNALSGSGIETSLSVVETREVRTVIGAVEMLADGLVRSITPGNDTLQITGGKGETIDIPFDTAFLFEA